MAKTKQQKALIIDKIEKAIKDGASSVFVHFTKVTVAEESAMRRTLRESGVSYFVAKKTLIRRALDKLGLKHDDLPLDGEVAIASGGGEDVTVSARLIHEFGKKLVDLSDAQKSSKLMILGGVFEGKLMDQTAMREIATIPGMSTLRGMFANIINSPIQRFAVALGEVAKIKN